MPLICFTTFLRTDDVPASLKTHETTTTILLPNARVYLIHSSWDVCLSVAAAVPQLEGKTPQAQH